MIKIALTGKLRAGKSAVASYLSADYGFEEVAFGSALKYYADKIFAYSDVSAYKPEVITKYGVAWSKRKPRRLYQDFGQKLRELDPHIWISHAEAVVQIYEDKKSTRSEEHTSELQSREKLVCRLLLEKKTSTMS